MVLTETLWIPITKARCLQFYKHCFLEKRNSRNHLSSNLDLSHCFQHDDILKTLMSCTLITFFFFGKIPTLAIKG